MTIPVDQAGSQLDDLIKQHKLILNDINRYTQDCNANNNAASIAGFNRVINQLSGLQNNLSALKSQTDNKNIITRIEELLKTIQNSTLPNAAAAKVACQKKTPETNPPQVGPVPPKTNIPGTSDDTSAGNSGQGTGASNTSQTSTFDNLTPGKRPYNPLGDFASYTYQLSLYAVTPAAYDAFTLSGRKEITALRSAASIADPNLPKSGAYIIAQGGGVNPTIAPRAPGFTYDYFLDNLKIASYVSPKSSGSEVITTTFSFSITEPMGFSLVSNLRRMSDTFKSFSGMSQNMNKPLKHIYILGIKFYGYDDEGNIRTGQDKDSFGNPYDPVAGKNNTLFERFYDIEIYSFKFKLDGKATVYNIQAVSKPPDASFSQIRGVITNDLSVNGSTVADALQSLVERLNSTQASAVAENKIKQANTYKLQFATAEDERIIGQQRLVSEINLRALRTGSAPPSTTPGESVEQPVSTGFDATNGTFQMREGTSVIQAINQIVTSSTFLKNQLDTIYKATPPDKQSDSYQEEVSVAAEPTRWYNLSSTISNARWDDFVGDWAYDITYIIRAYETPVSTGPYSALSAYVYPGAFKQYSYWFTGENKEVLSYDINFENNYWLATIDPSAYGVSASQWGEPIQVWNQQNALPRYLPGQGTEAQNNYLTFLYDPAAVALSKLNILGDPDFLCFDSSSLGFLSRSAYAPDGFAVNPLTGFMFVEIIFKEGVDYNINKGTFTINDNIYFWSYPETVRANTKYKNGIILLVYKIDSTFAGGKFTQSLSTTLPAFPNDPQINFREESARNAKPSPAFGNGQSAVSNTGLLSPDTKSNLVNTLRRDAPALAPKITVPNDDNSSQPKVDPSIASSVDPRT